MLFLTGNVDPTSQSPQSEIKEKQDAEVIEKINLGVIQTFAKFWLGENATAVNSLYLSMFIKTCLSMSDTISDLSVAIQLFLIGKWEWGLCVVLIDYLPMWQVLLHTSTSQAWKDLNDRKEKLLTVLTLFLAPIAFPIFQIRWLVNLRKDKQNKNCKNNFLHQNCRVAELISGTVESPMQFLLMITMYIYNVLPTPWSEDYKIKDSVGNELNIGALPGVISVSLSSISIINNALDISESKSPLQMLSYASFSLTMCIFRMTGYILSIITFREFSISMFLLIALTSLTIIVRLNRGTAKGFSLLTTFIVGIFIPCAVSEEPQRSQYTQCDSNQQQHASKTRRTLTARIAMGAIPVIMVFNIILLILLTSTDYKLSTDMVTTPEVSKQNIKRLIIFLVIPSGIFSFIVALCIKTDKKPKFATAMLVIVAMLSLSFVIASIHQIVTGEFT